MITLGVGTVVDKLSKYDPREAMYIFLKQEGDSEFMKAKHRNFYLLIDEIVNKHGAASLSLKIKRKEAILRQLLDL